jgi:hypothetical protein
MKKPPIPVRMVKMAIEDRLKEFEWRSFKE